MDTNELGHIGDILNMEQYETSLAAHYVSLQSRVLHISRLREILLSAWQHSGAEPSASSTAEELVQALCLGVLQQHLEGKPLRDVSLFLCFAGEHLAEVREAAAQQTLALTPQSMKAWLSRCYKSVCQINEAMESLRALHHNLERERRWGLYGRLNGEQMQETRAALRKAAGADKTLRKYATDYTAYTVMTAVVQTLPEEVRAAAAAAFAADVPDEQGAPGVSDADVPLMPDLARFRRMLRESGTEEGRAERIVMHLVSANRFAREQGYGEFLRSGVTYREHREVLARLRNEDDTKEWFGTRLKAEAFEELERFVCLCAATGADSAEPVVSFGGPDCPPALLYDRRRFIDAYKDYLTDAGKSDGTARTFFSALYSLRDLPTEETIGLFECRTVAELRRMVLLAERDLVCQENFAEGHTNAPTAFREFRRFIATRCMVEAPGPELLQSVRRVLAECFSGCLPESPDELTYQYFRSRMEQSGESEPVVSVAHLRTVLDTLCAMDRRSAPTYRLPEYVLDDSLLAELRSFIDERLDAGAGFIHTAALRCIFCERYPQHPLFAEGQGEKEAAEFLHSVLQHRCGAAYEYGEGFGQCWLSPQGCPMEPEELYRCLYDALYGYAKERTAATGKPITREELFRAFDYVAPGRFATLLQNATPALVDLGKNRYVHCDSFGIPAGELDALRHMLIGILQPDSVDALTQQDIYKTVSTHYPQWFANPELSEPLRNVLRTPLSCFKILRALWRDDYTLVFNRVSVTLPSKADRLTLQKDHYETFARSHPYFTLEELKNISTRYCQGSPIRFDLVCRHAVRVDEEHFVSRNIVRFDAEQVEAHLAQLMGNKTVLPISEVSAYGDFPQMAYAWNPFLLQQYLLGDGSAYALSHNCFCIDRVSGFIVRRDAALSTFEDAVTAYLREADFYTPGMDADHLRNELISRRIILSAGYRGLPAILHKLR